MADTAALIEAQELSLMQAWMHGDADALKKLVSRDFMMMIGSNPPELLDRPSLLAAADNGFRLLGFRLGKAIVRTYGRSVWYTAGARLDLELGGKDWSGNFLLTDLWRKHRIGGWKLSERTLSQATADDGIAGRIGALQQWR